MKRTFPLLMAMIAGYLMVLVYFIPPAEWLGEEMSIWFDVVAAMAFVLGAGNLLKIHLQKVSKQASGWGYSAITVLAFLTMLVIGLGKIGVHPEPQYPDAASPAR
jgi:hypothetical protein